MTENVDGICVGDRVEVVHPDPEHGGGCIAAGYDAAYVVVKIEARQLWVETRLPMISDPLMVTIDEVKKVAKKPWWDAKETLWHA